MTQAAIQQAIYRKFFDRGVDGLIADDGLHNIFTSLNPSGDTPFGKAVFANLTTPNTLKLPDGTDLINNILGLTIFTQVIENVEIFLPPDSPVYPAGLPIGVMSKGRAIILPEVPVAIADSVFYRTVAVNPAGQDQIQTLAFNGVAASGQFVLGVPGGNTAAILWNDNAAAIQGKINAVFGPGNAVVGGSIAAQSVTIDFGSSSQAVPPALVVVSGDTLQTGGAVAVTVTPTITQNGYLPGLNFNPGDFRNDSDNGNASDANAAGAIIKWKWFAGSDVNGFAVLELS